MLIWENTLIGFKRCKLRYDRLLWNVLLWNAMDHDMGAIVAQSEEKQK